jgi:NADH-quinone oxidoreductase subunit L
LWKIFDSKFIDGIVNGAAYVTMRVGEYLRRIQTGFVQNYALVMFAGTIVIFLWLLFSL